MKKFLKQTKNYFLDLFFPVYCLVCKKEGVWLCKSCLDKIQIKSEHVCGICEKVITPDGRTCHACKKRSPLDALIPATSYSNSCISNAIHFFKYRFIADLHLPLAKLMTICLRKTDIPLPDLIIPIPLHKKRLRWRGFNQSYLLASPISKNLLPQYEIPINKEVLIRKKYTSPQMEIKNYKNRRRNIIGAFSIVNEELIKNKTILLIDDVTTTGSTIIDCAKVLKENGAKEVYAAVIARQEIKE